MEKDQAHFEEDVSKHGVKEATVESVALTKALEGERPGVFSKNMLKLYFIMMIGYLISSMSGFDSSLMSSINDMTSYQKTFGLSGAGSSTGVVFIIYNVGQIAAFPFCGLFSDTWGRRIGIFTGCFIVLCGTVIQATAHHLGQFIGGRFLLGFGAAIACTAGPTYTVELSHPAYRGTMAGAYNTFWYVGSILAGWTTYGTELHFPDSSWAWRAPTIVQCGLPCITMCLILFFPESPRWLIMKDRREEAVAVLAKYHADGNVNAPIVTLQVQEITEDIRARDSSPWWNFSELFNTRAARYRSAMVVVTAFFGQWSGNNVVSYFLPEMVAAAGITSTSTQLLINAINPIFSMLGAMYGATLLDRLGRRKMMLWGLAGGCVAYAMLTGFTAGSASIPSLGYGTIVSIYLFGIIFSWGWTPLQTLYAVECLENRTRMKGSGLNWLSLNIASLINTYGISVGIAKIGWKLYLVYIAWQIVEMVVVYFFFVETKGRTIEEMTGIFESPDPRNASLRQTKVELDETGYVVAVDHDQSV